MLQPGLNTFPWLCTGNGLYTSTTPVLHYLLHQTVAIMNTASATSHHKKRKFLIKPTLPSGRGSVPGFYFKIKDMWHIVPWRSEQVKTFRSHFSCVWLDQGQCIKKRSFHEAASSLCSLKRLTGKYIAANHSTALFMLFRKWCWNIQLTDILW